MILYIAEKPSLGRAIAQALPRSGQKGDGFTSLANGDCVSWCIVHLFIRWSKFRPFIDSTLTMVDGCIFKYLNYFSNPHRYFTNLATLNPNDLRG